MINHHIKIRYDLIISTTPLNLIKQFCNIFINNILLLLQYINIYKIILKKNNNNKVTEQQLLLNIFDDTDNIEAIYIYSIIWSIGSLLNDNNV